MYPPAIQMKFPTVLKKFLKKSSDWIFLAITLFTNKIDNL
ncbi:hypothetical protein EHF_0198 [Ehrlichia japonica]|uniref:Uncharacterized protein n=1 Tax=Ehrlichia japonica TaxID=391036 RepID=X5GII2_9RICK|nr:hypothetical protein EHF_0198 [Ehrlichia japonica]